MTVCNGQAFLLEAIRSVQQQETLASWELIVVDDGSTDASRAIALSFAAADTRITVLTHPYSANLGISASRNCAMEHARGDVLAFLDADDVWLPYRLEHQLALLRAHPEIAMVYGQAERWWDFDREFHERKLRNGRNYIPTLLPGGETSGVLLAPTLLRWFLRDESLTPCTCSALVRTRVAQQLGGFEALFRGLYDDQVFYAKVSLEHPILADTRCVARYRRHAESCCSRGYESDKARAAFVTWLTKYVQLLPEAAWMTEAYEESQQIIVSI